MSNKDSSPELVKIVLIGGAQVGKTNLITKFTKDEFHSEYITTIGKNFSKKKANIDFI